MSGPTARLSTPGTCTFGAPRCGDAVACDDDVGSVCSSGSPAQTGSSFQVARGHGSSSWLGGGMAAALFLTGVLAFFEADTLTPLCGGPLARCDGATPDDASACWASAVPATRKQEIEHAISEAGNFIVSPPDWSVSLPRRKRRWPLRKKSLLTPTLAHTILVASVWPPFDLTARPSPPHCWPPNLVQSDVD